MTTRSKLILVYFISAIFIIANIILIVKGFYWISLLPLGLFLLLMFFFALDKVLMLVVMLTPLAVNLSDYDERLAISLPTEPLMFGLLLVFVIKVIFERNYDKKILRHPVSITVIIYLLWMLITSLTSEMPVISLKFFLSHIWFIVPFYFIAIMVFRKFSNIRMFGWLYAVPLIGVIIYASYRFYLWGFDEQAAHWIMEPFFNDHTAYGAAISFFIPVFTGFVLYKNYTPTFRLFAFIVLIFLLTGLYLSYSRAAWISVAISLAVALTMILKIKFRWFFLLLALFLGAFFYFQDDILMSLEKNKQDSSADFVEHVQSISNISSDASNLERINRWQSALRMFSERPLLGWGPGTYQFVYAPFQHSTEKTIISTNAGNKGTAHSEYIGPLAESGIPGLLSILAVIIAVSYTAVRLYNRLKDKEVRMLCMVHFLGLITYFIHGSLNNFLDTDKSAVPFWGFVAIIVAIDLFYPETEKTLTQERQSDSR